jgi:ABC-2 type transport system permease protein
MRTLRVVASGFRMNLKMLGTSSFFLLTSVVQPIIFATVAFYMFRSGGRNGTLLYASLGAGMMGVWSTTLFGSGGMIQWQRWQGTLELGAAAPPPMALLYLPFSLANAFTGMYAMAATLVWGRVVFGIPLQFAHPWLFALSLPATVLALGLMGLVLASTFILYRNANALSNLLEYPVWIASGLVFSTSLLPAWTRQI